MHTLQALSLNGTSLPGRTSFTYDRRLDIESLGADGQLFQTYHGIKRGAPKMTFETASPHGLLGLITGSPVLPFVALNGTTGLVVVANQLDDGGPGWETGTVAKQYAMARGQLFIDGLTWSPDARLAVMATAFGLSSDGTTDPVAESNVASAARAVAPEIFTLTAATVGAVSLATAQLRSVDVQIGHKAENNVWGLTHQLGNPFPQRVVSAGPNGAAEIQATIRISNCTTAPANGVTALTFTSITNNGSLGSKTITVTINGALSTQDSITGSDGALERTFTIRARDDGTNLPITIAVAG